MNPTPSATTTSGESGVALTRRVRVGATATRAALYITAYLLGLSQTAFASTVVDADHPHIRYTGRVDHADPKAPSLWWPGSEVTARFEGSSIGVRLDDHGDNYFYAFVDGGPPLLIDLTPGLATYTIATGLTDTTHTVTLFKRTETAEGRTSFRGFVLDPGKSLAAPPARPARRIEFYGDSITSGHSVASRHGDSNDADDKDNYYAFPAITARLLDAEYHCISVTGIGLFVDAWGFGGDMQSLYYDRLGPSTPWDFDQWIPQVVVVNLGQNDAWGPHTPREAIDNYVKFTRTIRGHYPEAHIILTLGCMQATDDDSPWPEYLSSAVNALREEHADRRVHGLIFPYSGDPHPTAGRHLVMAEQLRDFIRKNVPDFEASSPRTFLD